MMPNSKRKSAGMSFCASASDVNAFSSCANFSAENCIAMILGAILLASIIFSLAIISLLVVMIILAVVIVPMTCRKPPKAQLHA